jgi:protein phosphatase
MDDAGCFLVADGMGGAAAGEVASSIVRDTVFELCSRDGYSAAPDSAQELVSACFKTANQRIFSQAKRVQGQSGMGCTAELMVISENRFVLGHVGDSRSYLLRRSGLERLTSDHTFVQAQQDQGLLSEEAARTHSMRHVILKAVGINQDLDVDIVQGALLPGDLFLLCSDGLTSMVQDQRIRELLMFEGPLSVRTTLLVDEANSAGGKDNVSVVLVAVR